MAKDDVRRTDIFSNFFPLNAPFDVANSATARATPHNTNLAFDGDTAWAISELELWNFNMEIIDLAVANENWWWSFQLLAGEHTAYKDNNGSQVIHSFLREYKHFPLGTPADTLLAMAKNDWPIVRKWDPPILFAASKITCVVNTVRDQASWRANKIQGRLSFTTVPLDRDVLREVWQTWALS